MSNVLDRILKLLKLAEHAGSEAEAANAGARARALMAQHEITDAEVRAADPSAAAPEPIEAIQATETQKRVGWHWFLAVAVAQSYNCKPYWGNSHKGFWDTGSVYFFGRQSNAQAARYTLMYLIREVEACCQKAVKQIKKDGRGSPSKAWTNAFRIGASRRVAGMLLTEGAPGGTVHAARGNAVPVLDATDEAAVAEAIAMPAPQDVSPSEGAMVLIQRERQEVDDAYVEYTKDWKGSLPSIGRASSGDGYRAGQQAAGSIRVGGSRGGLRRGTGALS